MTDEEAKRIRKRDATRRYRARRRELGIVDTPEQIARKRASARAAEIKLQTENPEKYKARRRAYTAAYRQRYPDKVREHIRNWRNNNRERWNESRREHRIKNYLRYIYNYAKRRANKTSIEFTITLDDIPPMGTHCPVFGRPFVIGSHGKSPDAPSLDRIDSARGYVPGNVWIIGDRANRIKNAGTAEEHELIAKAMRARGVR